MRVRGISFNGGFADVARCHVSNEDAASLNYANNAWNINFSNANLNNNNKANNNRCRPVAELDAMRLFVDSFFEAYNDCMRNKRTSAQAIEYMPNAAQDIPRLAQEVMERRYSPSLSTCFMVTFPKLREVFAAAFRDRVVHHWICLRLIPLFEQRCNELGNCAHACRVGYGTTSAVRQVEQGFVEVSKKMQRRAWVFKGDIIGFFMHINRELMWNLLRDLIIKKYDGDYKDELLYLTEITVKHEPQKNCVVNGSINQWKKIEPGKSLFFNEEGCGMPIGNLTTQLFAGYYMSFLDEYVRKLFNGKNYSYTRYVDDFVIVCDDKRFLKQSIGKIADFVKSRLKLGVHTESVYFQPVSHGVKFVGSVIKYGRTYTINRTKSRMRRNAEKMVLDCRNELTPAELRRWEQIMNSYYGFVKSGRSWNFRKEILGIYNDDFYKYFTVTNNSKIRTKTRYRLCY